MAMSYMAALTVIDPGVWTASFRKDIFLAIIFLNL
jgi:hypothetical protein